MEERQPYGQIKIFALTSVNGMLGPGSLTLETIQQVESEVQRLDQLKARKMKELFLKKRTEVDEICKKSHMDMPYQREMDNIMNLITSGDVDHDNLLKTMDEYIYKAKEEATSRNDIMDKVEKWTASIFTATASASGSAERLHVDTQRKGRGEIQAAGE